MKQGVRAKCRRITSGFLAFIMVFMLVLGDAGTALASEYGERFFQDGFGLLDEDEYSDTVSTKASFKNHTENGVTISVSASDDSDFRAGGEVYLDVHVKNESNGMITDGVLNFQGRKLKDSGAYFEELTEDAVTEGIMENAGYEEEDEDNGSQEVDLINDLEDNSQATLPVHKDESETPSVRDDGADKESIVNEAAENDQESAEGTEGGTEEEIKNIDSRDNRTEEKTDTEHNENVTVTENNVVSEDQNSINVEGNDENANAAAGEVTTAGESNSAEPADDANIAGGTEDNKDPWLDEFDESEDGERRREILAGESRGDNKKKNGDEEDEEEDDGPLQEIEDIQLAPGQIYSVRFVYTVDESIENAKNQHVVFRFSGKDEDNKNIRQQEMFYYTANYLNAGEVRFKDGNRVRTGDEITMGIHTGVYDFDILLGDDEVKAELASRSDAEKASASDAQKATASNAQKATASDATKYTDPDDEEEDEEEDEEDNDDFKVDLGNTTYKIEMINARLNGFKARKALVEDANDNMLICTYRVSKNVKPGIYFGKVIQESKVKGKTFKSSQGFALIVTGQGEIELKGGINGSEVTVKGPVESFPDGDVLGLKVSEVSKDKKALVEAALEQKARETGISVNKLRALDIKVVSDGEEMELQGDVSVTFSNVKLEPLEQFTGTAKEAEAAAVAEDEIREEEPKTFSLFGMRRMSRKAAVKAETEPEAAADTDIGTGESEGEAAESTITVWHLDESAGVLSDMGGMVDENGDVVMDTNHFSIFIIVNVAGGMKTVPVTVEHWAYVNDFQKEDGEIIRGVKAPQRLYELSIGTSPNEVLYPGAYESTETSFEYKTKLEKIYSDDTISLQNGGGTGIGNSIKIEDISKLSKGGNYTVKEVTITNAHYPTGMTVQATSHAELSLADRENNIKIIYEMTDGKIRGDVEFHDYNVSVAGNDGAYHTVDTQNQGINDRSLLPNAADDKRIGVGIQSDGTSYSRDAGIWHSYTMAKIASPEQMLKKDIPQETLVKGGDGKYEIKFNGYQDPGLFTPSDIKLSTGVVAKKYINDYELEFKRKGDTYTLSSVYKKGSTNPDLEDLEKIRQTYYSDTKKLYSNLFWPLDNYTGYKTEEIRDPLFPGVENPKDKDHGSTGFPFSDEASLGDASPLGVKKDHNWYFGMRYDFEFTLGDYIGPLDYYFRGDDDFWLYIDGKLVKDVDLGGIHSSIGAYVDLKTWLNKNIDMIDKNKKHEMSVFFMERGGTGSCCYMQFTLPNISPIPSREGHTIEKTVVKNWQDGNNQHNTRPSEIYVQLLQNGQSFGAPQKLHEGNDWKYTWNNLPKFRYVESDKLNIYTVKELTVLPGYQTEIDQDKFIVTNIETTYLKVEKEWVDSNNQYHTRPSSIQVQLYKKVGNDDWAKDGEPVTLSSNTDPALNWKYGWRDKSLYEKVGDDYQKVEYRVEEVADYWLQSSDNPSGWYIKQETGNAEDGFKITNTYQPSYVSKVVEKNWEDEHNKYGLRPGKIAVQLMQNGNNYGQPVELNDGNDWKYTWANNLPEYYYETNADTGKIEQKEYVYTVEEQLNYDNSAYYTTTYSSQSNADTDLNNDTVTITNTLQTARFRVAKRIDNIGQELDKNDLAEDQFIIEVKDAPEGKIFSTGLVLKHAGESDAAVLSSGEISKYIVVPVNKEKGSLYNISEVIQKEYTKADTFLTLVKDKDANGNIVATLEGEAIRVMPGADAVVIVHNVFDHRDFFHHDAFADNDFSKGVPKEPQKEEDTSAQTVDFSAILPEKDREKLLEEEERLA